MVKFEDEQIAVRKREKIDALLQKLEDKNKDAIQNIKQESVKIEQETAKTVFENESNQMHKWLDRSFLVFAGMCIGPAAAFVVGEKLPGAVGLGLGLGIGACVLIAGASIFKYIDKEAKFSEKMADAEQELDELNTALDSQQSQQM